MKTKQFKCLNLVCARTDKLISFDSSGFIVRCRDFRGLWRRFENGVAGVLWDITGLLAFRDPGQGLRGQIT